MLTELHEVAAGIIARRQLIGLLCPTIDLDGARTIVEHEMPGESPQVVDGVAQAIVEMVRDRGRPKEVRPRERRYTRSIAFTDGRDLADLWLRDPIRRGEVLRQVEDRIICDRVAGMMLLLALQHWLGRPATSMVDDIQAHLAPDMG